MITNIKQLKSILEEEYTLYNLDYKFGSCINRLKLYLIKDRRYRIWKFQKYMRKADYFRHTNEGFSIINKLLYLFYAAKRNSLGEKLGFDFQGYCIAKGIQLYHANVVINSRSIIGQNVHFHGENVIGNNGINSQCPNIGNNVMLGAGAKIFGDVTIADNIKIGAGSIVVKSFTEQGITIGGIPAKRIK